jgi:hypothetical protein
MKDANVRNERREKGKTEKIKRDGGEDAAP